MDIEFEPALNSLELKPWLAFKWICKNFLGNNKSHAYNDGVEKLIGAYNNIDCRMSLRMLYLHFHLISLLLKCAFCNLCQLGPKVSCMGSSNNSNQS